MKNVAKPFIYVLFKLGSGVHSGLVVSVLVLLDCQP